VRQQQAFTASLLPSQKYIRESHVIHAPEINHPDVEWLNTSRPLDLAALRGRLVLLDFWTFCCVNCLHVIPVLRKLEKRFGNQLVVIGIHSPKFTHERKLEQVREAVIRYEIGHPVIHDPDRQLWQAYAVRAWPTLVLISGDGYIIGTYPGEPRFSALEALINTALEKESSHNGGALIDQKNEEHVTHKYRYPAKIKIAPGTPTRWVMADTGHHQIALLNDHGSELQRYGSGESGFADGTEENSCFNGPEGICCSGHTIYVADTRNHAIRCIDLESGRISTLAGTGERGIPLLPYWNKSRHVALASPWDVELVGDRLFFANAGTHQLGEIRLGDGCVRLAAGNGREGIHDGPGPQAQLAQPSGLAYDGDANLLYFVDSETSSIRCLDLQNRWVKTLIGKGLFVFGDSTGSYDESRLQHPLGLAYCAGKL
jgi:thiol-disulfide isomerase/thioredoxin